MSCHRGSQEDTGGVWVVEHVCRSYRRERGGLLMTDTFYMYVVGGGALFHVCVCVKLLFFL